MSETAADHYWKKCNSCKKEIAYGAIYWVCNVSTCNRKRLGLSFCTVSCWDAHLPGMNHRESWAEERTAPSQAEWAKILSGDVPKRTRTPKVSAPEDESKSSRTLSSPAPKTILRRPR